MIYLDNAATSFPKPQSVIDAVCAYMTDCGASPGRGAYPSSIQAAEILAQCQYELASLFSISDFERIIFTKNATEALNTAIFGIVSPGDEIIISSMEHNAVMRCAHECVNRGASLKIAHASPTGKVSPESIEALITPATRLIVLIHSSNVCGTVNDIYSVQRLARKHGVYALFDCAQSAGVIPIDASDLDMIAFSGHKGLFGPFGTGGLYVSRAVDPAPLIYGGTGSYSESARMPLMYPDRFHAGTLNISGIAGLLEGVRFIRREGVYEYEREITDYLYTSLSDIDSLCIPGEKERTSVVGITAKGFDPVLIAERLGSEFSVCARAGLQCAPMAHRTLGTISSGTVRFSPGFFTKKSDVDFAVGALKKIISK